LFENNELAKEVWQNKYAVPDDKSPDDMHKRMAKEFAKIELNYQPTETPNLREKLSKYGKHREFLSEDNIYYLFKDFKYIIPQGSIMATLGTNQVASLSNCWVVESPLDSYSGIHKTDGDLIYYYMRRGGVGVDISNLRPANTTTNNAAKSSTGATSFMHRFSNTTREVGMNGRRAALMISIDVNHPDVLDFIKIKRDGTSVTGANISIRMNNDFMKAVENDEDYILRFPCDYTDLNNHTEFIESIPYNVLDNIEDKSVYLKKIKAKEYWNEIIHSAKNYAEPGIMYWDNILNYDPAAVYDEYKPITSNPCGEQFLQANDSCRLMVHNLFSYVVNPFTENAYFDFRLFYEHVYEGARLGDNLIDLEVEYIQRIIDKIKSDPEPIEIKNQQLNLWEKSKDICKQGRRIGMGITSLADCLAALNLKYDSDEALVMINKIFHEKMKSELDCTIDLAILREPFVSWDTDSEYEHWQAGGDYHYPKNDFYKMIMDEFPNQCSRMWNYGRRNISISTVAPTGSVSILADNCSSGIEPLFSPYYFRRKKINPNDKNTRIDFIDQNGDSWQEYAVIHPNFIKWINYISKHEQNIDELDKSSLDDYFISSPWYGSTANDIDWIKRVEIQSIIQKYTTNAISSTVNLPSTVTEKEVSDIYMTAWKQGLKGITTYTDGSRSGVLITESTKDNPNKIIHNDAPKRPKNLPCDIYSTKDNFIIVGLLDSDPYEIFVTNKDYNIPNTKLTGELIKQSKGNYKLVIKDVLTIDKINTSMTDEHIAISRLISAALRHGTNVQFITEQLLKSKGEMFSFSKQIARILKLYIPDGKKSSIKQLDGCTNPTECNIVFEEGCLMCKTCGNGKC
jgi:ribonucleoside-diphosphate reductase alpha chain